MLLFTHRSNVPVVANIYAATGVHDVAGIKRCLFCCLLSVFYGWRPTVVGVPNVACVPAVASIPDVDVVLGAADVAYLPTVTDLPSDTELPAVGNIPAGGVFLLETGCGLWLAFLPLLASGWLFRCCWHPCRF